MRLLVYVQNKDDRSQIRASLSSQFGSIVMVNSYEEAVEKLQQGPAFEGVILDDSFDRQGLEKGDFLRGPTTSDLLLRLQQSSSADAVPLLILRDDLPGSKETLAADRQQGYSDQGIHLFLQKPFNLRELKDKLGELSAWILHPPEWATLLKAARTFLTQKQPDKALQILQHLRQSKKVPALPVCLLYVQALRSKGGEFKAQVAEVLTELVQQHPRSVALRAQLVELAIQRQRPQEASSYQVQIFQMQPSPENYKRCQELAQALYDHTLGLDQAQAEALYAQSAQQLLEVLASKGLPHTTQQRAEVMRHLASKAQTPGTMEAFVTLLEQHADLAASLSPEMELLFKRFDQPGGHQTQAHQKLLFTLLKGDPTLSWALERAVCLYLEKGEAQKAAEVLEHAAQGGAKSLEFQVAYAKVMLGQGELKAASDRLHLASTQGADDPRVLELREQWRAAYASKAGKSGQS